MSEKKVRVKRHIVIGLILAVLAFLLPQAGSASGTKAPLTVAAPAQAATAISDDQLVVAGVVVRGAADRTLLAAASVHILGENNKNQVFIQTTFAELERLKEAGWSFTLMYVRGAGSEGAWQPVPGAATDCTGSTLDPDHKSFPGSTGFSSFQFIAPADCEWTILVDVDWVHISGPLQGTGSTTVSFSVDANPTTSRRVGDIFIGGLVFTVYQGRDFIDVPQSNPFYVEIGKLSARGITSGCGGDNFCPSALVARDQMAALIVRSLGEFNPPTPASQRFNDVPPDNQFYNFIDRLAALGITSGCGNNNYCPANPVLRQEMAAFIIRALGEFNPPPPATQRFSDVPPSNPFYNFIDRLAALGITSGCATSPPRFCPADPVTRGQMAAFLSRAFDL
jgi:S-layer homology domain